MGGVDINDRLKATHEQDRRDKRYYLRLGFDMLDQMIVNSRIAYNTVNPDETLSAKDYLLKISEGIVAGFTSRSRSISDTPIRTSKTPRIAPRNVGPHWAITGKRERCCHCKADLKSYWHCSNCKVALCLNKDRNCFHAYHHTEET